MLLLGTPLPPVWTGTRPPWGHGGSVPAWPPSLPTRGPTAGLLWLLRADWDIFRNFASWLTSCWWLEIHHGGSRYTPEISQPHKSGLSYTLSKLISICQHACPGGERATRFPPQGIKVAPTSSRLKHSHSPLRGMTTLTCPALNDLPQGDFVLRPLTDTPLLAPTCWPRARCNPPAVVGPWSLENGHDWGGA